MARTAVMVKVMLEPDERAYLVKMAKANGLSIGEYLRVVMLLDGVTRFDVDALRIAKRNAMEKVLPRVLAALGVSGLKDAPGKA